MTVEMDKRCRVGIVDYGLGNLFSIQQAATRAGMEPLVTGDARELAAAAGIILPGVGAFGDAIKALRQYDLVEPLKDFASSGKPILGVCLGMQLMMEESTEFGRHRGLGFFPGVVERLAPNVETGDRYKVPHIGWSAIRPPGAALSADGIIPRCWHGTSLDGIPAGEYVYFIHSFRVRSTSTEAMLATTDYGGDTYCSAIAHGNVSAFQFHPEKSGSVGIRIYRNFAAQVSVSAQKAR